MRALRALSSKAKAFASFRHSRHGPFITRPKIPDGLFAANRHSHPDIELSRLRGFVRTCVDWEWFLLLVIAPLLFFAGPTVIPLLAVVPGLWVCRKLASGRLIPKTSLNPAILTLAITLLVSLIFTYERSTSAEAAAGLVLSIGVYFAVVHQSSTPRRWAVALVAYLTGGTVLAAIAPLGTEWLYKVELFAPITRSLPPRLYQFMGPEGTFHPNIVAGTLLWILPVMLGVAVQSLTARRISAPRQNYRRETIGGLLSMVALLIVMSVFVLLQSRGAYMGFLLSLTAIGAVAAHYWGGMKPASILGLLTLGLALAGVVGFLSFGGVAMMAAGNLLDVPAHFVSALKGYSGIPTRLELWSRVIMAVKDHPLTGLGIGAFQPAVWRLYPLQTISREINFVHPHNHLLSAAVDLGIPGLVAYVWIWVQTVRMLFRTWRTASTNWTKILVLGFSGSLLAYFIYGMTDAIALGTKPGVVWWYMLGLIAALHNGVTQEKGWEQGLLSGDPRVA